QCCPTSRSWSPRAPSARAPRSPISIPTAPSCRLAVVGDLLAPHVAQRVALALTLAAQRRLRHEVQPLRRDRLLALLAQPIVVGRVGDLRQRPLDLTEQLT